MRTGHAGAAAQTPANPTDLRTPAPAAVLQCPVAPASWRGAVRCGLVALVAGEVPLGRVRVPSGPIPFQRPSELPTWQTASSVCEPWRLC
jgi:hypothetical protein